MMQMDLDKINAQCHAIKLKILELAMSTGKNGAHIGGALSVTELLSTLLSRIDFSNPENRDRIILSKGHGALALYGALWQNGLMTEAELSGFDKNGTGLYGHPHKNVGKGIDFSAGSLGLGVSYAVGTALGLKKKGSKHKVYVIAGDGECNEGIVWEALMSASNFKLPNLVLIIDRNGWQLDGSTSEVMDSYSLTEKLRAFGFSTIEIDGHDIAQIKDGLRQAEKADMPFAIVADTIKGNGVSFLVNTKESHFCPLSAKKYQQAAEEINTAYANGK